jgi:hypothetical protein
MKRLFVSLCIILSLLLSSKCMAQDWGNYVQIGAGSGTLRDGNTSAYFLQFEYGKIYKWLDFGLSLDYANDLDPSRSEYWYLLAYTDPNYLSPDGTVHIFSGENFEGTISTSLNFNVKLDIIRIFTENSRHALKVGFGYGIEFFEIVSGQYDIVGTDSWKYQGNYYFDKLNLLASYEFDITDKIAFGLFYNNYNVGLSLRRNF